MRDFMIEEKILIWEQAARGFQSLQFRVVLPDDICRGAFGTETKVLSSMTKTYIGFCAQFRALRKPGK